MATKKFLTRLVVGTLGAGGVFVTYSVYTTRNLQPIHSTIHKMKANELPVYQNPESRYRYEDVQEEISSLTEGMSVIRKKVWKYADATKETRDKIQEKWEISKAHTTDLIERLKADPNILPNLGFISIAGLGGILIGYRKGIFRKFIYSSALIIATASLCYPNQAVDVSVKAYNKVVDHAKDMWQSPDKAKKKEMAKEQVAENKPTPVTGTQIGDMGQSKEEDKDMYTTRTS